MNPWKPIGALLDLRGWKAWLALGITYVVLSTGYYALYPGDEGLTVDRLILHADDPRR